MTSKTVVIADDTPSVHDRFKTALENAGHRTVSVRSAAQLLARVRADSTRIDLILLNLCLPHAAGVDLVRSVRKVDAGRVPILLFSGTIASAADVRDLAALNVAGYVNEHSTIEHILPSLAPHLFPDNFNRRSSSRVVLGIPVSYRVGDSVSTALTLNLGKGGLSIRTMQPLEAWTRARIRFCLPNTTQELEADSRIAWGDPRVGMGLQFEHVEPTGQAMIDEFVDQHFLTLRKA